MTRVIIIYGSRGDERERSVLRNLMAEVDDTRTISFSFPRKRRETVTELLFDRNQSDGLESVK